MFEKMKLKKMVKRILNRKRQLEWIKKKRKLLPEPVEKKITNTLDQISAAEKKIKDSVYTFAEAEKLNYEIEHNFKISFGAYKQNAFAELFDELWLVIVIALILKFFVIGSFRVPTGSMVNTIEIGDNLFVAMFAYGLTMPFASNQFVEFGNPERGEIITFTEPNPAGKALVKRVVGVPGDSILISGVDVYVNGTKLEREFTGKVTYTSSRGKVVTASQYLEKNQDGRQYKVIYNDEMTDLARSEIEGYCKYCNRSFTVPERSFFAMGDNRDDSLDSRFWGFVPRENLQGKPLFVWFSIQFGDSIFDVIDFRPGRIGHIFQ
ncbi:MAG TPA: signal peptidase I [bacterium]|nr:signal peptidase I [bacterium]